MAGYNIGTAWIQVAISGSNLTREVEGQLNRVNTSRAENSIISGLGGAFRKVGKIAAGAFAVASTVALSAGFADITKQAIDASDATNKFKNTLNFAGKSAADVDRLTKSTKEYADKTVYGLSDIQSITAQLASNNVQGYDKLAEAAGNLNAVAGGNAETFKSVGMVLTQTAGQGNSPPRTSTSSPTPFPAHPGNSSRPSSRPVPTRATSVRRWRRAKSPPRNSTPR